MTFRAGFDGNRNLKGRPKRSEGDRAMVAAFAQRITPSILDWLEEKLKAGDERAHYFVADRLWPKPPTESVTVNAAMVNGPPLSITFVRPDGVTTDNPADLRQDPHG